MKKFNRLLLALLLIVAFAGTAFSATVYNTIQVRRGAAASWTASNPVLAQGELAYETDTGKLKIGDGLTHWVSLAYYPSIYSSEWIQQNAIFTYISATQFSAVGNVTSSFPAGIRVQAIVSAGTIYGTVTTSVASSYPITTTITVQWDSGSLDTGLSAVSIGIFSPVNSSVPSQFFITPGIVVPYVGSTAPTGWLLCYGQEISRTTYATLYAIIGTSFGSGNGSTTFNLPDLRGRAAIGPDNMGGGSAGRVVAATSQGVTGGAESVNLAHTHTTSDHTLTIAEMPAHSHNEYQIGSTYGGAGGGATPFWANDGSGTVQTSTVGGGGAHNHGPTGSALGTTEIMPPFVTINFIIKY
jgi:microcystin-dependent protein